MGGTASQKKEADAALWLWQHAVRLLPWSADAGQQGTPGHRRISGTPSSQAVPR
ncbi:hypothetical protein V8E36_005326 [Tilletia maclaganii]